MTGPSPNSDPATPDDPDPRRSPNAPVPKLPNSPTAGGGGVPPAPDPAGTTPSSGLPTGAGAAPSAPGRRAAPDVAVVWKEGEIAGLLSGGFTLAISQQLITVDVNPAATWIEVGKDGPHRPGSTVDLKVGETARVGGEQTGVQSIAAWVVQVPAPEPRPRDPLPWLFWAFFLLLAIPFAFLAWGRATATQPVPVLAHAVLPYQVLTTADIVLTAVPADHIMTDTLRRPEDLVGHRTRQALPPAEPVRWDQIAAVSDPVTGPARIAVPVVVDSSGVTSISPGQFVSIAVAPRVAGVFSPTWVLTDALVLDLRLAASNPVAVLGVPAARWTDVLSMTHDATVILVPPVPSAPPAP